MLKLKIQFISFFLLLFYIFTFGQEWSEPVKLPEPVNTNWESYFPFITHDGTRLYFASNKDIGSNDDIFYCDWDGENWGNAVRLGSNINTFEMEHSPSVTADGKTLYFVRYTNQHSYDIYYSTRDDTGWGKAVNIGPPINTNYSEWTCCISAGGDTLIFSCFHYWKEMYPLDLCMSVKTDAGWSYPELLFKDYDSNAGDEVAPSLSGDGKKIYFQNTMYVAWERDIWYTEYVNGVWTPPVSIGPSVNTPQAELSPSISHDGNTLYFARMYNRGDSLQVGRRIYMTRRLTNSVGRESVEQTATVMELSCYPNPFNTAVRIQCTVTHSQWLEIKIFNIHGKEVRSLTGIRAQPGLFETVWDGTDNYGSKTGSGIYFCRLALNGQKVATRRLVFLK